MTLTMRDPSMTTVDRTPKPCPHPRANHQHGTFLAYSKDGCRCWPCLAAHSREDHDQRYRTATGTHTYVDAAAARAHVAQLLEVLTVGQVERRSGVNRTAIRVLVGDFPGRPPSKRITRTTERALLAVTDDRLGAEQSGLVDGTGTRRRFRALVALGWPARHLQGRLGIGEVAGQRLAPSSIPEGAPVLAATRDAVRRLYDDLALTTPAPSRAVTRARRLAAMRDWPPPMAWDDDTIDDPKAEPAVDEDEDQVDEFDVELVCDGHSMPLAGLTLLAALDRLTEAGHPIAVIADRVRIPEYQVHRLRGRTTVPRQYRKRSAA